MSAQILTPDRRVRVFLSSRIPEFAAERKALVRMIKQMGLTPVFFEELPRPHPPRDLYSAYLERSDLFLGIYGRGYGWIDTEGGMVISGVHDQWQLSVGMPRLVFVKDESESREPRLDELLIEIGSSGVSFNRFKTTTELVNRARDAIALCLTERFLAQEMEEPEVVPNYVEQLAAELEEHPVVATRFLVDQVRPALVTSRRVFVEGSPGTGKTVTLYQIAQNDSAAIYLSLRNQSLLSAASYLVTRLAEIAGEPVHRLSSAAEALEACDALLIKVPARLLIDDVDQAPDVAARLADLAPGEGRLIFAGRSVPPAFLEEFRILRCTGFLDEEAEQYLFSAFGESSIHTQTAVARARGNPLYLRYYIEDPSPHPPTSITGFHAAMWAALTASQKELLAVLALSEVALKLAEISEVLGTYRGVPVTAIAAQDEMRALGHLVSTQGERVRLFHPAFRDFVCTELASAGLAQPIHRALAEAFSTPSQLFLRVIHSVRGGMAAKVYNHLLRTAAWADVTGRMKVSRELLASAIRLARQRHQWAIAGLALHQSADLKQHTRNMRSALLSANLAEKMLLRSKAKDAALAARITKAIFLLEVDRGDEAEVILKAAIEECVEKGLSQAEAGLRVNLSYLYVRRGRLAQCAEECEKARAIFEGAGDLWGVALAVLNAQSYYIATFDRPNQIRSFKRLLEIAKELDSPRVEMAAYNGMTVFYRREKNLAQAERICLKAIALARNLGIWSVEAVNTGNLGNVYRDQKRYDKARECYETLIRIGAERSSKHHLAMGKEMLATIVSHEGDPEAALKMADEVLVLWREIGDTYREANTEDDQGDRYRKLRRHFEAGKSYERAADSWIRSGLPDSAIGGFGRAFLEYTEGRHYGEAARCFESAWTALASPDHAEEALRLLDVLSPAEPQITVLLDITKVIETAAPLFSAVSDRIIVIDAVTALADVCKRMRPEIGEKIYAKHIRALAEHCRGSNPPKNAVIALAFSIEQAPAAVIDAPEFKGLCSLVGDSGSDLGYRNDNVVGECWTVILQARNALAFEFRVLETIPGIRAAVVVLMFLLWAECEMIIK